MIVAHLLLTAKYILPNSWLTSEGSSFAKRVSHGCVLTSLLTEWAAHSTKPVVLLIDEIGAIVGDTLVAVLTQLRDGQDLRLSRRPRSHSG